MPSPPPAWNFTWLPNVRGTDAYWHMKEDGVARRVLTSPFADLHLPRNSPIGFFLAFFAVILGFAMIWRIYWLAAVGVVGAAAVALIESWKTDLSIRVPGSEVEAFEYAHGSSPLSGSGSEDDTPDVRVAATSEGQS